jgi:hypothetical protein
MGMTTVLTRMMMKKRISHIVSFDLLPDTPTYLPYQTCALSRAISEASPMRIRGGRWRS